MTDIFFYQLPENAVWTDYEPFLPLVSEERRARATRISSVPNRILCLCPELLLRRIACERLLLPNSALHFSVSGHGKPFLVGHEDFFFNWSHTRNALALAVADTPVGIDIERCRPHKDARRIAERFFAKKEASYVTQEVSDPDDRFCEVWTRKEAFSKFTGNGLTVDLRSFDVMEDPALTAKLVTFRLKNYIISLCCDSNEYTLTELREIAPPPR